MPRHSPAKLPLMDRMMTFNLAACQPRSRFLAPLTGSFARLFLLAISTVLAFGFGNVESNTVAQENSQTAEKPSAEAKLPKAESLTRIHEPLAVPDRIILNLTADPAHSIGVNWRTNVSDVAGILQIKVAEAGPDFSTNVRQFKAETVLFESDLSKANYHSVVVDELLPKTQYTYRVGDGTNWSEWSMFRTASDESADFSFIYFGDAQNDIKSRWSRIVREAFRTAPRADFMLHAGDLINSEKRDSEWGDWFYAGGWINRSLPSISTPGNHEYRTRKINETQAVRELSPQWRPTFTLPKNGPDGLLESCYFIDYQGCRFVSINSNEKLKVQAEWLDAVLSESPQRWTIVTMHHPVYSTAADRDNPAIRNTFQPIFDKHRVDLVLQGHDHTYGRTRLMEFVENVSTGRTARSGGGTLYVVSVSGPKMYPLQEREIMARVAEDTQLFQVIHVAADRIRYEARTATGELYDAFDLEKVEGERNRLIDRTPDTPARRRAKTEEEK